MKPRRKDLRTEKTYAALFSAFEQLIRTKPFEKITVTELCRVAQTRPATFYNHFSDKYDFFAHMIRQLEDQNFKDASIEANPADPEAYLNEWLTLGFNFIDEHAAMVESVQADTLLTTIMQTTAERLTGIIISQLPEVEHTNIDTEVRTQVMIGALFQTSRWWLAHRQSIDKQDVLDQLRVVVKQIFAMWWFTKNTSPT